MTPEEVSKSRKRLDEILAKQGHVAPDIREALILLNDRLKRLERVEASLLLDDFLNG